MTLIRAGVRIAILVASVTLAAGFVPASLHAASSPDANAPYDAATRDELQSIITKQLDAFNREDASAAENLATPQFRDRYPDPASFLAMVKENYAPLFKPRSTRFAETTDSPHGPLQKMTVVASDGTIWTAVYVFERIDGAWRISGCGLMKQDSQDI